MTPKSLIEGTPKRKGRTFSWLEARAHQTSEASPLLPKGVKFNSSESIDKSRSVNF